LAWPPLHWSFTKPVTSFAIFLIYWFKRPDIISGLPNSSSASGGTVPLKERIKRTDWGRKTREKILFFYFVFVKKAPGTVSTHSREEYF
jgi:hypothetical protein